ncbi:hypothetical protein EHM92_00960 [bacterium]|nr:MAG: hypothetical protein EHM92_00960 [bacterium]
MMPIFKKEILENIRSYRFMILTALLGALMFISILVSYGDYQLRMENYNVLKPQQPTPEKIIIPPTALSIFVKGLDTNLGRLLQLSALGIDVQVSQQSVNRLFTLFTVPDMLFVIKVMLSLMALLFAFDALSAEKEQGTLKLLLAGGAGRFGLLFGKLAGRFALVFVPFAVLFTIAVTVVSILPDVQTDIQYWTKLGVILLASGVYCLSFTALGILISTLVHRSSTAVIVSLAAWTLFIFIIPNLGISFARNMAGVPPGERVEMQGRLAAVQAIYERIQKEKSGRNEHIGIDMVNQVWAAQREIFENYRPRLDALMRLTRAIVRTSPAGALTFLMTDVAGTGFMEDMRLKDAVMLHVRLNYNKYMHIEPGEPGSFAYARSSIGDAFALSALVDSLVIVAFAFLCIGLAAARFAVYDPR